MSSPKVSVCIPVYNGGPFLGPAVASVLNQTFTDFELRICDDASTDGSWDLATALKDPRVIVSRNTCNLGPEANWNRCLEGARGAYLKLFHQDDLLEPECLAQQVAVLDVAPGAVLTFCRRRIIDPAGRELMTRGAGWSQAAISGRQLFRRCLWSGTNPVGEPSAVLFRRDAWIAVGRFNGVEPYLIDLDYWFRLMDHGSALYQDEPLASFRLSTGQWSSAIGKQQSRQFGAFIRRLASDRFPDTNPCLWTWSAFMAWGNSQLRRIAARWAVWRN